MFWMVLILMPFVCFQSGNPRIEDHYIASAKQALKEFQEWHWGLHFRETNVFDLLEGVDPNFSREIWHWSSSDGQRFRIKQFDHSDEHYGRESYANVEKGYSISTNYQLDSSNQLIIGSGTEHNVEIPEGVREPGASHSIGRGHICQLAFAQYLDQSLVTKISSAANGKTFDGIRADHPDHGRVDFLFDKTFNLVWVRHFAGPNDHLYHGPTRNFEIKTSPVFRSKGLIDRIGPFEYVEFGGRKRVSAFRRERLVVASMKAVSSGQVTYSDFEPTVVGHKIDMSENVTINNGESLHCEGRPFGTYVIKNNEVVLALDSVAIDGFRKSSFFGSGSLYWTLPVLLIGVFFVVVWLRNRHDF